MVEFVFYDFLEFEFKGLDGMDIVVFIGFFEVMDVERIFVDVGDVIVFEVYYFFGVFNNG